MPRERRQCGLVWATNEPCPLAKRRRFWRGHTCQLRMARGAVAARRLGHKEAHPVMGPMGYCRCACGASSKDAKGGKSHGGTLFPWSESNLRVATTRLLHLQSKAMEPATLPETIRTLQDCIARLGEAVGLRDYEEVRTSAGQAQAFLAVARIQLHEVDNCLAEVTEEMGTRSTQWELQHPPPKQPRQKGAR